ncbi:MAG TPA: hypothetical protein VD863_04605 [Bradyrhizobium sp.]|nr:hypothetical protein [Bradyrhizobium sp.]
MALRRNGPSRCTRLSAALLIAAGLGGCAGISDKMSETIGTMPAVGLPANAPERPAERPAYPAVHDMPPQRTTAVLTADEQRMMERELVSARDGQKAAATPAAQPAAAKPAAARRRPAPQPAAQAAPSTVPVSSSRMIY